MRNARSKLAAIATLASLALLAGVALAAGSGGTDTVAPAASTVRATATPEVRTEVVRRTVHRRVRDDRGRGVEPGDDRGGDRVPATAAAPVAQPTAVATVDDHGHHGDHFEPGDDHGGDRHDGDDSSGHGGGDD
jgi:hypothetical protein